MHVFNSGYNYLSYLRNACVNLPKQMVSWLNWNVSSGASRDTTALQNKAALTLQKAWGHRLIRKEAIKATVPLYFTIKSLGDKSLTELGNGSCDSIVQDCLKRALYLRDREALRFLAYVLFAGEKRVANDELRCLCYLMFDKQSLLSDIADLLHRVYEKAKPIWLKRTIEPPSPDEVTQEGQWLDAYNANVPENAQKDKEIVVNISHGGGLFFLRELLTGHKKGYAAPGEYKGFGFFVTPNFKSEQTSTIRDIDLFYACRHPERFEVPAVLQAQIKAKYLQKVPNLNEAALRADVVKDKVLKIISIEIVEEQTIPGVPPDKRSIDNLFPSDSQRKKRIIDSICRVCRPDYKWIVLGTERPS